MVYNKDMALRNAFDNLGTESALRRIANLLTFARDSADRIRVVVDSGSITGFIYTRNANNSLNGSNGESYNGANAWNSIDARDSLRATYNQRADFAKRNRWTF